MDSNKQIYFRIYAKERQKWCSASRFLLRFYNIEYFYNN